MADDNDLVTIAVLKSEMGHIMSDLIEIKTALGRISERNAEASEWRAGFAQWRRNHEIDHTRLEKTGRRDDVLAALTGIGAAIGALIAGNR